MLGSVRKRRSNEVSFFKKNGFKAISLIALLLMTFYSAVKLKDVFQFPISDVKIFGVNHLDHDEVQRLLTPLVSNGFFATEVSLIKDRLLQLPWVADVSVRRVWPDKVTVTVTEKIPVARWNNDGLLSSAGDIFNPSTTSYPIDLPQFVGPLGQQIYMLHYYEKINRLLTPLHFKIARLELTPFMSWNMAFNGGIKLSVGRKDVLTRIDHFVKVYSKVVGERAAEVDYVDLRYPNGFAVKWKTIT